MRRPRTSRCPFKIQPRLCCARNGALSDKHADSSDEPGQDPSFSQDSQGPLCGTSEKEKTITATTMWFHIVAAVVPWSAHGDRNSHTARMELPHRKEGTHILPTAVRTMLTPTSHALVTCPGVCNHSSLEITSQLPSIAFRMRAPCALGLMVVPHAIRSSSCRYLISALFRVGPGVVISLRVRYRRYIHDGKSFFSRPKRVRPPPSAPIVFVAARHYLPGLQFRSSAGGT